MQRAREAMTRMGRGEPVVVARADFQPTEQKIVSKFSKGSVICAWNFVPREILDAMASAEFNNREEELADLALGNQESLQRLSRAIVEAEAAFSKQ